MKFKELQKRQRGDWLHLSFEDIRNGDLGRINRLDGLGWLDLRCCRNVTDAGIDLLDRQSITHLDLGGTSVTNAGVTRLVGRLTGLVCLDLTATGVTDEVLESLVGATTLRILCVWATAISEAAALAFRERRPDVQLFAGVPTIHVVTFSLKEAAVPTG